MALVSTSEEAETRSMIVVEWAEEAGLSPDDSQLLGEIARVGCFLDELGEFPPVSIDTFRQTDHNCL
jgi:hypothetical protein